jgi:type III pantothenate kinase
MLLAIDVGKSQTVSGIFNQESLVCHWRLKTDRQKTADELAAGFRSLFAMQNISFTDITGVVIASVVPTQQQAWHEFTKNYLDCPVLEINGQQHRLDTSNLFNGKLILTDS